MLSVEAGLAVLGDSNLSRSGLGILFRGICVGQYLGYHLFVRRSLTRHLSQRREASPVKKYEAHTPKTIGQF